MYHKVLGFQIDDCLEFTYSIALNKGKLVNSVVSLALILILCVNQLDICSLGNYYLFNFKLEQTYPYIVVAFICLLLILWYSTLGETTLQTSLFAYQRDWLNTGEWWRIFTAHFMHSNVFHFILNIIGLFLLWLLHGEYSTPRAFAINILLLCAGISLCIYIWSPAIFWYVGLSGVLHGIFAWGVVIEIFLKRKTGYLLLVGLIVKLIDEQFFSTSQFMSELIEVNVAIDAHFYGAVIGLVLGTISVYFFPSSLPKTFTTSKKMATK